MITLGIVAQKRVCFQFQIQRSRIKRKNLSREAAEYFSVLFSVKDLGLILVLL